MDGGERLMRFLTTTGRANPKAQRRPSRNRPRRPFVVSLRTRIWLGVLLCVLALAGSGVWWWQSGGALRAWQAASAATVRGIEQATLALGFGLDEVLVEGRVRTTAESLRRALALRYGAPVLTLDLDAARARVVALPWVRDASIRRMLPGTLHVSLVERAPFARWQRDGKVHLVDRGGEIIPVALEREHRRLPLVVGAGAAEHAAALLEMLATEPDLRRRVIAAVRVGDRRWDLKLGNGIEVRLPETGAAAAWHRLAEVERNQSLLARDVVVVDLRLSDRMVVRTRAPSGSRERPLMRNLGEKST